MGRYLVTNRFDVDPQADPDAVRGFAEALKKHGAAHYGPGQEGQPGELPFSVEVNADSLDDATQRAVELVDRIRDLPQWLRYAERWLVEELPEG
jgi:hypothetical protein